MAIHHHVSRHTKNLFKFILVNFFRGLIWGLGGSVGLAIFLAIAGYIMSRINVVPVVGTFVGDVATFVLQNNPQLVK